MCIETLYTPRMRQCTHLQAPQNIMLTLSGGIQSLFGRNAPIQLTLLRCLLSIPFVFTATGITAPAYAQEARQAEIDKLFSWATSTTPGCACAVSQNGNVVINRAYGAADLERDVPMSPGTIFDIGSSRKQFVAAAILLLAEEKQLSLSDDVHKYVPELPDYGYLITLDHLLTHTSGIRDWTGLIPIAGGDPDALTLILRQRGLNFAPGEEWSYSNSGYVLLTEIVARTSKLSFAEFMRKRLFEPLGMKSTAYVNDLQNVIKNRALAYGKAGNGWKLDMLLGNDRGGAGALLSTASDLLIWNEALTSGRIGVSISKKLQEPARLNNGRQLNYARGLFLDMYRGTNEVWHSGSAAGYHSWIGRYPEKGLSVAVLCNSDAMPATVLARRVADQFLPAVGPADPESGPPPALTGDALADVNSKAGLFISERTGELMRLVVDRGRFRLAGGPGLVGVSKDRFRRWGAALQFMSQDKFELSFVSPDQFDLRSMEGQTTRYRRAQPFAPTAADLKAISGRYQSSEIGGFFDFAAGKDGLVGRANDASGVGFVLTAVAQDMFQLGGVTLRFLRDTSGKVVALNYSNPLVRPISFTKVSD